MEFVLHKSVSKGKNLVLVSKVLIIQEEQY